MINKEIKSQRAVTAILPSNQLKLYLQIMPFLDYGSGVIESDCSQVEINASSN